MIMRHCLPLLPVLLLFAGCIDTTVPTDDGTNESVAATDVSVKVTVRALVVDSNGATRVGAPVDLTWSKRCYNAEGVDCERESSVTALTGEDGVAVYVITTVLRQNASAGPCDCLILHACAPQPTDDEAPMVDAHDCMLITPAMGSDIVFEARLVRDPT